jgi:putative ABC transport system permease protein
MALGVVLLVGASLLTRSLVSLNAVDPGVDPEGVLTTRVALSSSRFPGREERTVAMDQILGGIRSIPGVEAAAAVDQIPFGGGGGDTYVFAQGRPPEQVLDPANTAQIRAVTEDYFSAMGIAVLRGRAFGPEDRGSDGLSTIIDEELARRLWPNEDPLGRELVLALDSTTARVVGVVENVRQFGLGEPTAASFFLPFGRYSPSGMNLVVKAADRGAVMEPLRAAVWEVDPDQPLTRVERLDEMISSTTASNRFQTALLGVFALMALLLASIGIYGVLSFYVGQRRREIGIRMALGAEPGSTVSLVLRRGGILIVVGIVFGLAGSAALTRLLAGLLYGVEPIDPVSFLAGPSILVVVAFLASYLPARRASRIDPGVALRGE